MKLKVLLIPASVIALIILYVTFSGGSSETYRQQLIKEREERDNYMRTSSESPFAGRVENFTGLKYYPPDQKYLIVAEFIPATQEHIRTLQTSDGKENVYKEYAFAEFDLDNRRNRLVILEMSTPGTEEGTLFLAFADETSAFETYGAGRYLDLKKLPKGSKTITLDFNKAYNP